MEWRCILCEEQIKKTIKNGLRDSKKYNIVQCLNCEHVQLSPVPSAEDDEKFYDEDLQLKPIQNDFTITQLRDKYEPEAKRQFKMVKSMFSETNNFLEIGAGYGLFLSIAEQYLDHIDGVEISQNRREISEHLCKSKLFPLNLLTDEVPQAMISHYDVILLFHVLEHIGEPKEFLRNTKSLMRPEGNLLIEVPNLNDHMLDICSAYKEFYFQRAHVSYFTPGTLSLLANECGFRITVLFGIQRYSIGNAINWLTYGKPQVETPMLELPEGLEWVEDHYKSQLREQLTCDTIVAKLSIA